MVNLNDSKKVYDYLRYVYNLTSDKQVKLGGLGLTSYLGKIGLDGVYYDLIKNNHIDVTNDKVLWIASEPSIKMANALIEKAKQTPVKQTPVKRAKNNKKAKTYKDWTESDVNKMHYLTMQGESLRDIAKKMNRTHSSIKNKYRKTRGHVASSTPIDVDTFNSFVNTDIREENDALRNSIIKKDKELSEVIKDRDITVNKIASVNLKLESIIDKMKPIHNDKDCEIASNRIYDLMNNTHNKQEENELEVLGILVSDYEDKHHPVPNPKDETHYSFMLNKLWIKIPFVLFLAALFMFIGYLISIFTA